MSALEKFSELERLSKVSVSSNESQDTIEYVLQRMATIISDSGSLKEVEGKSKNFEHIIQMSTYAFEEAESDVGTVHNNFSAQSTEEALQEKLQYNFRNDFEQLYLEEEIKISEDLYKLFFDQIDDLFFYAYNSGIRDAEEMREYLIKCIIVEKKMIRDKEVQAERRKNIKLVK